VDTFQRVGALSNAHVGREFTAAVKICFAGQGLLLSEEYAVSIGFKQKKLHKFDLGSAHERVLVECKSYTWRDMLTE
jgi:hypothetical protein